MDVIRKVKSSTRNTLTSTLYRYKGRQNCGEVMCICISHSHFQYSNMKHITSKSIRKAKWIKENIEIIFLVQSTIIPNTMNILFVLNIDLRVEKQQHHLMGVYYSRDMKNFM